MDGPEMPSQKQRKVVQVKLLPRKEMNLLAHEPEEDTNTASLLDVPDAAVAGNQCQKHVGQ